MRTSRQTTALGLAALLLVLAGCSGEANVVTEAGDKEPFEVVEPPRPPAPIDHCAEVEMATEESPVRLLTRYEYDNTVRDLLGIQGVWARELFPPENAVDGWENGVDSHTVSPLLVRRYLEVGQEVTSVYLADGIPPELASCMEEADVCANNFLTDFLTRAFRRPPTAQELQDFTDLSVAAFNEWGLEGAVEIFVASVLNSPQFLYRVTLPPMGVGEGQTAPVSSWEMASRLSYFVWGSMPDDQLFAAAAADELQTEEQIRAHTERMLDDPRSLDLVGNFYRQWLKLDKLDTMVKDDSIVPNYDESIAQSWKDSLDAYVREIHANGGGLHELMTGNQVYLNDQLGPLYGMNGATGEMTRFDMGESRSGLLTQPALMAILAYPNQGSPIHRGIFVREQLLCQHLSAPPDMNLQPPDPDPNATTRERFDQHTENASCAGCHVLIDPIGFGFENYDAIGRFREVENGKDIDNSGGLVAMRDPALDGEFNGVDELAERLAGAREVQDCVAQKWVTFALGGAPAGDNLCAMQRVQEQFATEGGSFRELMVAITTSEAFRYTESPSMSAIPGGSE